MLRYRDPVYRSLRELALSYFTSTPTGPAARRCAAIHLLSICGVSTPAVVTNGNNCQEIEDLLAALRHYRLISVRQERCLHAAIRSNAGVEAGGASAASCGSLIAGGSIRQSGPASTCLRGGHARSIVRVTLADVFLSECKVLDPTRSSSGRSAPMTAQTGPLLQLEQRILESLPAIERWFGSSGRTTRRRFTDRSTCATRLKLAPVDMNLFPGGFNNLSEQMLPAAVQAAQTAIDRMCPDARNLLLIPERHTRNQFYLTNVARLVRILRQTGLEVAWVRWPMTSHSRRVSLLTMATSCCSSRSYAMATASASKASIRAPFCEQRSVFRHSADSARAR